MRGSRKGSLAWETRECQKGHDLQVEKKFMEVGWFVEEQGERVR